MSRQTNSKNVEVITLDSESDDADATVDAVPEVEYKFLKQAGNVTPSFSTLKTSPAPATCVINSTGGGTTPSIVQCIGGFINDFRTLTLDIQRLKTSEKFLKEMLESKQIELNKASEEWCTAQAELAKNEMLIEAQQAHRMSLEQQIKNVQIRNTTWDSKLEQVSCGLETMFQKATNMMRQDDRTACTSSVNGGGVSTNCVENNAQLLLQVQPYVESVTTLNLQKQGIIMPKKANSFLSSKWRRPGLLYQRNSFNISARLKFLREKFSKRMVEKQQFQRDIKNELARKSRLLRNLAQFVHKRPVNQRVNKEVNLDMGIKNVRSLAPGRVPSILSSTTTKHARDHSIPVQDGYACTCGKHFKFIATLHRHLGGGGGGNKKFTCDICNMTFLYFSNLSKHLRDNHKQFSPNTHGCRTCGAVFPSKTELMQGWKHRDGKCIKKGKGTPFCRLINSQ